MALVLRLALRQASRVGSSPLLASTGRAVLRYGKAGTASSSKEVRAQAQKEMESFWAKNIKLRRPWSPHLTIYKPQLTSMLSLIHRASGIAMAIVWSSIGVSALYFTGHYTEMIEYVHNLQLGPAIIFGAKYILCWPLIYHYVNGMRHLAWDYAIGFSLKATYRSGWFCLGTSFVLAAIICNL